jgi:hypothetical protein
MLVALVAGAAPPGAAQGLWRPDMPLDALTRGAVIDALLDCLNAEYVFPDTARAMEQAIRAREIRGEYDALTGPRAFAESLTAHLRAVSLDHHLEVQYSAARLPEPRADGPPADMRALMFLIGQQVNFGFERVERLEGNVGYMDLRTFGFDPEWVEDAAAAAFALIANTDALIIDVRRNAGGSPYTMALVSSYLFGKDTVHLSSLLWREGARTERIYTRPVVRGRRYGPDKPVYVLTGPGTFSGAEAFAYTLQTLKRAVIVGETTVGGAHPAAIRRVTDHFAVWMPGGQVIDPVTGTNWERVGVRPNVAAAEVDAGRVAHALALYQLIVAGPRSERARLAALLEGFLVP